ncbi:hypothetical protein ABMA27_014418 [Loxostege sticticalis]|uniref:Uncharacterized protein n=1 Tax=Loxostege sticticalis TaxID=481309 RepID=A0ABR3I8X6_LOXSC
MATCPFSKIIEDIFKVQNTSKSGLFVKDSERAKLFLNSIANITGNNNSVNLTNQEDLVDKIIASINTIKNNITSSKNGETDEAIILNVSNDTPKNITSDSLTQATKGNIKTVVQIKSGIEEKIDATKANGTNKIKFTKNPNIKPNPTTEKNYVEILTIEPNNTTTVNNTSQHSIIDVLKQLMPMFNSTLTKELHNITIIERNHLKNHSFTATKNVSTIIVTYCDKENLTKANISTNNDSIKDTDLKVDPNEYEYYTDENSDDNDDVNYDDDKPDANLTRGEKKDILEAAEYGMQKMHELYSVLEPKLYSMGLWLDDTNPARYVAAFNAPSEEAARFSRYGYATLQAATRFKQLSR